MKVLHINTLDTGGAALAARRLHLAMRKEGIQSKFLSLTNNSPPFEEKYFLKFSPPSFPIRFLRKVGLSKSNTQKYLNAIKEHVGKFEAFSSPLTDHKLEYHPLVAEADVIHLHWVSNFINWPTFFKNIDVPIVWTLHDMNPLQGGFHYNYDLNLNEKYLGKVNSYYLDVKLKAIKYAKNITIVSPSRWLHEISQQSKIFAPFNHFIIQNGLNSSVFTPRNREYSRSILDIPLDKKVILFVSDALENRRKGYEILLNAFENVQNDKLLLVSIGNNNVPLSEKFSNVLEIGRVRDELLMSIAYSSADVFCIPSIEDNLPNTVLESLSCGTPVVGFNIGGIPQLVLNGINGFISPEASSKSLSNTLMRALSYNFNKDEIRNKALEEFDGSKQAKKYISVYDTLIKDKSYNK